MVDGAADWASREEVNPLRLDAYHPVAKEGAIMDPHFHEYIAAIAGMADIYGEETAKVH